MRTVGTTLLAVLGAVALPIFAPAAADACSLCLASSSEATRYAFIWTTGFLSALPLVIIGSLVWFLLRRARELSAVPARAELGIDESPSLSRSASSR